MTACLTDSQIDGFVDGSLSALRRAEFEAHVAGCPTCTRAVSRRGDDAALFAELRGALKPGPRADESHTDVNGPEEPGEVSEPLRSSVPGYQILHELHRGGQGVVYKAIQKATRRTVALKLMLHSVHASARQRARFEREIDMVAGLRHPHIVTIYDCGVTDGQPYFAMEFIAGCSLAEHHTALAKAPARGGFGERARALLSLFERICAAVAYAHQHGVIHRDLKPANILIDAAGEPHVVDFGLAKLTQPDSKEDAATLTSTGEFVGTLAYASPEQARGRVGEIDVRTDVYSLGVILYEMLTNEFPYPVDGPLTEVLANIADTEPTRPRRVRPELDGEVEAILFKTLAKEPARRYQSAGDLARDVERYLSGQAVDAKGDSTWYVLRKTLRRHRLGVGVAAAFALVIVAGFVTSLLLWRDAAWERDRARFAEGEERVARSAEAEERRHAEFQAYVANLAAANTALQVNDVVDARERLMRAPAHLRSWEWSHLQLRLDQSRGTFSGHESYIEAVAFSPDGKRLASCSWDKTARVIDRETGQLIARYQADVEVWSLAFHPKTGELALACWDGTVRLWNPDTKSVSRVLKGPEPEAYGVAFSGDGTVLAAVFSSKSGKSHSVKAWDTATWKERLSLSDDSFANALALSALGDRLAVAAGGSITLWDARTGVRGRMLTAEGAGPARLAIHPTKPLLLGGYSDRLLRLWDLETGAIVRQFQGHQHPVYGLAIAPNGAQAASGSRDKTIRVWDLESGEQLGVLCGHAWTVSAVDFSPDGKTIASGAWDNQVKLWDAMQLDTLPTLRRHKRNVVDLAFDPLARRFASASWDGVVGIWNLETGRLLGGMNGHTEPVQAVAYHPTEPLLASASWDRNVLLWNTKNGKLLHTLRGHLDRVHCVAFSPDGRRLVSGSRDNTLRVWDPVTGEELTQWHGHDDHVHTVAFSPDGTRAASAGHQTLRIWDPTTGRCEKTFRRNIEREDFSLAFHPGGRFIAAGSDFRTLTIWDIVEGKEVVSLAGHSDEIRVVAFSPDAKRLASAAHDGTVRLWDVETWTPLLVLHGYTGRVNSLAFSPDGTRLIAGLGDGGICVWDSVPGRRWR